MRTFKELLATEDFTILPGVYDCLNAKIAEEAGAKALFLSGGALSISRLGKPDLGFLNIDHIVDAVSRITCLVNLPLITDIDNGFGNSIHAADTAIAVQGAGANGLQIDDQILPLNKPSTHKSCLEFDLVHPKVEAVRNVVSDDFTILYRTVACPILGVEEAINRVNKAKDFGADIAYVDGISSLEEMQYVSDNAKIPLLINLNEKSFAASLDRDVLANFNFRVGMLPVSALAIAAEAYQKLFRNMISTESTLNIRDEMANPSDIYELIGVNKITQEHLEFYK